MKKKKVITITLKEYIQLIKDSSELDAMKCAGVDNWDGIDEVDWDSIDELKESDFDNDSRISTIESED